MLNDDKEEKEIEKKTYGDKEKRTRIARKSTGR